VQQFHRHGVGEVGMPQGMREGDGWWRQLHGVTG
jgi:hypothetical protein